MLRDELLEHLRKFSAAPFLFVGAGFSRRYLGLDNWTELLRRMSELAGGSYDYYYASANGDNPSIATQIAQDIHEKWWQDEAFAESRAAYAADAKTSESALKAEVCRALDGALDRLAADGVEAEELALLRNVVVDGIITTNYDPLLEHLFPGFKVFVGQDELLFSAAQGVGEIYKIHGSSERPDSLVLTAADYERFRERNPYLAAKLLTMFVEHPIVFLGYSLSDANVAEILRSIASILTTDRIRELQDRLLFVQWDPKAADPSVVGTAIVVDGFNIPVLAVTVPDFREVFAVLGSIERKFPARILRQLKEQVYELVRENDPKGRLYVQDLDADVDLDEVDVVLGVGAIEKVTGSYRGKTRKDILDDLLVETGLDSRRVVDEVLPTMSTRTHVPMYKYLRGAGLLDDEGELRDDAEVDERVRKRLRLGRKPLSAPASYKKKAQEAAGEAGDFAGLAARHEPDDVLMYVAALPDEKIDPEQLREYLLEHRADQFDAGNGLEASQWAKAVCLYDCLVYKTAPRARRPKKAQPRKGRRAKGK